MAVTTTGALFVGLLSSVIGLILGLFGYKTVLVIDTNTTDNNGVINGIYYDGSTAAVVDGFLYDYNGFNFCLRPGLIAPATNNNERKKRHDKGVSNTHHPTPRPTRTKEQEVKYCDCCDLICNMSAGLEAIAAVASNNETELGTEVSIPIDNCFERGEREREYNKGVSSTSRAISHPTSQPAKEREVEYCYCCDLICDLLIAGLTAPATIVTVAIEFDIRCGLKFGTGVPIVTTELHPLNMNTDIN